MGILMNTMVSPRRILIPLAAVFFAVGCEGTNPAVPPTVQTLASDYGFDAELLFRALDVAQASGTVRSIVVERSGTVVAEGHYLDVPPWGVNEIWSVTATFTSLLVGVALDRGYLTSLDQRLGDLLTPWNEHLDSEKADITIRQLLTMTSGVSRPAHTPDEFFNWMAQENHVGWILDLPLLAPPGERYRFDDGAAHLLSAALEQASGMSLATLAQGAVMGPMGVPWVNWLSDPQGVTYGGFGLQIRSRDMVKMGRLVLNEGAWEGRRLVSSEWVREAVTPKVHPYPDSPEWGFGFLWKITQCRGHPCLYQNGYGGQILVAFPTLDLVIALTSAFSEDAEEADVNHDTAWGIILDQVLPSVR